MNTADGAPRSGPGSSLAAERTRLARIRTVMAVLLTSALVARGVLNTQPLAALACLAVVVAALVLATRLGRPRAGAWRAAVLTGCVVLLALTALASVH